LESDKTALRFVHVKLIVTAKMNGVDPQDWHTDMLGRITAPAARRLDELLPWNSIPASSIFVVVGRLLRSLSSLQ
jgi:hypothetical protein